MKTTTAALRNIVLGAALGVGVAGGGAVALAQSDTTVPSTDAPTAEAPAPEAPAPDGTAPEDCERKGGEHRAEADAALAEVLGITTEELQAAREAAHDAVVAELGEPERPAERPDTEEERAALEAERDARHQAMEQALADQLGVDVTQLREARATAASAHLQEEVASGRITQEQADEMLEAIRNGEKPEGPRGHGPRGPRPGAVDDSSAEQQPA